MTSYALIKTADSSVVRYENFSTTPPVLAPAKGLQWVQQNPPEPPAPSLVPYSVSPRQIRQALTAAGLRAMVEASVAGGDQNAKDWWEFATVFERNHPMVVGMATGLGVTEQQLDDLFILAGSL